MWRITTFAAVCLAGPALCMAQTNLLRNSTMEAGGGTPDGWGDWSGGGQVARDTAMRKSGAAALRVQSGGGNATGFQWVDGVAGKKYKLEGVIRADQGTKAQAYVQSFDPDMKDNRFQQVRFAEVHDQWISFSAAVEIPKGHNRMVAGLMVEGPGRAWIDDLVLTEVGGTPTVTPSYVAPPAAGSVPTGAPAAARPQIHVVREGAALRMDYVFGETWKLGANVSARSEGGTEYLQIDATEWGGGGIILGGVDIAPGGETHLVLRARLMPGHGGGKIQINLCGQGDERVELSLPTAYLDAKTFRTVAVKLPQGRPRKIEQIQIQGANFSPGATPFKLQIASIGTMRVTGSASR